jgi:hypothetical protein
MSEFVTHLLMFIGVGAIIEALTDYFGLWVGIHYGKKGSEREGWWICRNLPRKEEWRKLGKTKHPKSERGE